MAKFLNRSLQIIIVYISILAAQTDFSKIDLHADKAPVGLKHSIADLVDYLIRPASNDIEKARALFRWITQNIKYDVAAFMDRRLIVDEPEQVLRRGRAVCGGYAQLFKKMCSYAGIPSEVIIGWSKGYGQRFSPEPDHAWNAIQLNGEWQLLDVTWGAGHLNEQRQFIQAFNDHYFLAHPQQLIYDHFPLKEKWQLLTTPLLRKQYEGLVLLRPAFFKSKLQLVSHPNDLIQCYEKLTIQIKAPKNTYLSAKLLQENRELSDDHFFIQRNNNVFDIRIVFPKSGNYTLRIFSIEGSTSGMFSWACDYRIEATNRNYYVNLFPQQYGKFFEFESYLQAPIVKRLQKTKKEHFEILVPSALDVAVISGENFFSLQNTGDLFSGDVLIHEGQVKVVARVDTSNNYHWLLEYKGD